MEYVLILAGKITRLQITEPDGTVTTFTPGNVSVSEANVEGVEGEPVAALGGPEGSPRTGMWCRYCGSNQNPYSDCCVPCWTEMQNSFREFGGTEEEVQKFTKEFQKVVLPGSQPQPPAHVPAPGLPQSPYPTTPGMDLNPSPIEINLPQREDSTFDIGHPRWSSSQIWKEKPFASICDC